MDERTVSEKITQEHKQLAVISGDLSRVAAGMPGENRRIWLGALGEQFLRFRAHMVHHVALEEAGGFLKHVLETHPALAADVEHLRREHRDILASIEEIHQALGQASADDADQLAHLRLRIKHVLSEARHHAEHQDLLMTFAYTQDIGGEA